MHAASGTMTMTDAHGERHRLAPFSTEASRRRNAGQVAPAGYPLLNQACSASFITLPLPATLARKESQSVFRDSHLLDPIAGNTK